MAWTEDQFERLRAMWDQGLTMGAIAVKLGVTRNSIAGYVRRLNLPSRGSPVTKGKPVAITPEIRAARFEKLIDLVADHDYPMHLAARQVGLHIATANRLWDELCERGGRQYQ